MDTAWSVFMAALRLTFQRIGLLIVVNVLWWLLALASDYLAAGRSRFSLCRPLLNRSGKKKSIPPGANFFCRV